MAKGVFLAESNGQFTQYGISGDDKGHTIINDNDVELPAQEKLQFIGDGIEVADDPVTGVTIVSIEGGETKIVQKPTVVIDTYIYDGSAQGPTITNLDSENIMVINPTQVNAGIYSVTFTLKNPAKMVWNDLTNADLIYEYTINKADPVLTLDQDSITFDDDTKSATINVTYVGDGNISLGSYDTTLISASLSGNAVSVTCTEESGDTVIVINSSAGSNYNAGSVSCEVICDFLKIVSFSSGTDEEIKAMLDAYYNDEITWSEMGWAVGDTRKIHLNSFAAPNPNSSTTLSEQDITVVIVAHDHTDLETPINGHTKSCITVQFRECVGSLGSWNGQDGSIYVNGDSSKDTTFTKWSNLYMRTYINNVLLGAMSSNNFKSAIKPSKHYRHTTYNGTESEQVTDTLFLPSYPEIYGTASYSNYVATSPVEGTQFSYYTTTSNRKKYGNNNGSPNSTQAYWWMGSASSYYVSSRGYHWCAVDTDGSAHYGIGSHAYGLAPAFAM